MKPKAINYFRKNGTSNNAPVWLVVSLILTNNFWSMAWIDLKVYQYLHLGVFFLLFYFILFEEHKKKIPNGTHKYWILALMLIPLLSVYSSNVIYHRAVSDSLIVYRMHLGLMLYFVLWYKRVNINQLKQVFLILGLGYAFLTIIQQFTYPFAPFGMRTIGSDYLSNEWHQFERRLGFARFEITGVYYAVIVGVLAVSKKIKLDTWVLIILLLSLIASGNRRVIGISAISLGLAWIYQNRSKYALLHTFVLVIVLFIVYNLRFLIFGDLANVGSDLAGGRSHSYNYFINICLSNPLGSILGFGLGRNNDVASAVTVTYVDNKPVVLADIGAVACWYYWGILYVIALYGLFISLVINKFLDKYYRGLALAFLLFLWILFLSWEVAGSSFIAMLVYACDLNIYMNKKKTKKISNSSKASLIRILQQKGLWRS